MPDPILVQPRFEEDQLAELEKLCKKLDRALEKPGQLEKPIAASGVLEEIGSRLWNAAGLQAESLMEGIDLARDEGAALPVIIQGQEHQHLPWELLYHANPELRFIGRHAWLAVVRRITRPRKPRPAQALPLRILLFTSSPEDLDPETGRLDYEREEELLFTALDRPLADGEVVIDVAEDGLLETLIERMENQRYHAVILSMHGTRASNNGESEWGLLFEDPLTWRSQPVAGSDLADRFDRLPTRRRPDLLVLSACRSARAEQTLEAIPSVAAQLNRKGIDRVLGMRLSVLDSAASAFSAEFFRSLAQGESVARALSLARDEVAIGKWLADPASKQPASPPGDLYAQWTLPVLLDRSGGALVDPDLPAEIVPRPAQESVLIGDGQLLLPERSQFIGRRKIFRRHLRSFLESKQRQILLTGPGGVGKTTLAGQFVRRFLDRFPQAQTLGFEAPLDLEAVYAVLFRTAVLGNEDATLLDKIQLEKDRDRRRSIGHMLDSLASRQGRPLLILLDNLESIQQLETLEISSGQPAQDSWWLVQRACRLASPTRVLLTGRYALKGLPASVEHCPVPDASLGDVLRRMNRLDWPRKFGAERKRWVYRVLGGNHRAIEWTASLLQGKEVGAQDLLQELDGLKAPPGTPEQVVQVVLDAMRQNLLLESLRQLLSPSQDRLLRVCCLFRVPVSEDGLHAVEDHHKRHLENRQRLIDYALLESSFQPAFELDYFWIPPVVKESLDENLGFDSSQRQELHRRIGEYHRFQGECVTRRWGDALEAIHHLRLAGDHVTADGLANTVAKYYYGVSNFAEANRLCLEIVERAEPPPPWWALNWLGMCQRVLGDRIQALDALTRALPLSPGLKEQVTTLNNISAVCLDSGNQRQALDCLQQSLKICREIGDKEGEAAALSHISQICMFHSDHYGALDYLQQSLEICREIGNKEGEGATLNSLASVAYAIGDYDRALDYLQQSLEICREIGNKEGEGATLNNLAAAAHTLGNYDGALEYLQQSLKISREIGDRKGEATTLINISHFYQDSGNHGQALECLQQSLKIHSDIGDKAGQIPALQKMAQIALQSKDLERAIGYLSEALQLAVETGYARGIFNVGRALGRLYLQSGNSEEGKRLLQMAVQAGERAGFPGVDELRALLDQADPPSLT